MQLHEAVQKHQVRPAIEVALAEVTGDQTCIGVRGVGIDHGKMQRPLLLAVGRQKDPAPAFGVAREVPRLLASADCAPDLRVVATELAVARHKPVERHERDVSVDIEIDVNRIGNRTPARMADEEDPLQLVGLAVLVLLEFLNRLDHRSEPAIPSQRLNGNVTFGARTSGPREAPEYELRLLQPGAVQPAVDIKLTRLVTTEEKDGYAHC